jgi:Uma2 family endonuclease
MPMSTRTDKEDQAASNAAHDPFEYGWRDVCRTLPDGSTEWEMVPLTLEDVLHPEEGDFRLHSDDHERFCNYLYNALRARLASDPAAVVFHDVRISWDVPGVKPLTPDISVIFGVQRRINWSTFDTAEEGTGPVLIIEITSPKTRRLDLKDKVRLYAMAGVEYYLIVDDRKQRGTNIRSLMGYRLGANGYEALAPDERGWLWMEPVGLWLGLQDNQVMCYDEAGSPIDDYIGMAQARAEAEARANTEAQARAEAEARMRELEEELRRLRGGNHGAPGA